MRSYVQRHHRDAITQAFADAGLAGELELLHDPSLKQMLGLEDTQTKHCGAQPASQTLAYGNSFGVSVSKPASRPADFWNLQESPEPDVVCRARELYERIGDWSMTSRHGRACDPQHRLRPAFRERVGISRGRTGMRFQLGDCRTLPFVRQLAAYRSRQKLSEMHVRRSMAAIVGQAARAEKGTVACELETARVRPRAPLHNGRNDAPAAADFRCSTCGCVRFVDVKIHGDGRSVRRDCWRCGHTIGFPIWNPNGE